jgi:hypothetical protein
MKPHSSVSATRPRQRPYQRGNRRAGISLTELMVVQTIAAAMIGLMGMMFHRLLDAESEATHLARFSHSLLRLSQNLRADVHAAYDADIREPVDDLPRALVLKLGQEHEVRYELAAHVATRVETRSGTVVHRDDYYSPPGSRLEIERQGKQQVQLTVFWERAPSRAPVTGSFRQLTITAVIGRDHRFLAGASPAEGGP